MNIDEIEVLDDRAAVRYRPGMYFGDCEDGSGLMNLVYEVLGNSIDQFLGGKATQISVDIVGNRVRICDDGPGVSVKPDEGGQPWVVSVLSRLHGSGTADDHYPHVHLRPSLYGVGVAPVNFLSQSFVLETVYQGRRYRVSFTRGELDGPMEDLGPDDGQGTSIWFTPDFSIFKSTGFALDVLHQRLVELACFNPGLILTFQGERIQEPEGYCGFARRLAKGEQGVGDPIHIHGVSRDIAVDVAFHWVPGRSGHIRSFVSLAHTPEDGTHVLGFLSALGVALNLAADGLEIQPYRIADGLVAVVNISMDSPRFGNPCKNRLKNPEVVAAVVEVVVPRLLSHLQKNSAWRNQLCDYLTAEKGTGEL